jgi:hypothetical protein
MLKRYFSVYNNAGRREKSTESAKQQSDTVIFYTLCRDYEQGNQKGVPPG